MHSMAVAIVLAVFLPPHAPAHSNPSATPTTPPPASRITAAPSRADKHVRGCRLAGATSRMSGTGTDLGRGSTSAQSRLAVRGRSCRTRAPRTTRTPQSRPAAAWQGMPAVSDCQPRKNRDRDRERQDTDTDSYTQTQTQKRQKHRHTTRPADGRGRAGLDGAAVDHERRAVEPRHRNERSWHVLVAPCTSPCRQPTSSRQQQKAPRRQSAKRHTNKRRKRRAKLGAKAQNSAQTKGANTEQISTPKNEGEGKL